MFMKVNEGFICNIDTKNAAEWVFHEKKHTKIPRQGAEGGSRGGGGAP